MAYKLAADEDIDTGLRRIFLEEISKVRRALDDEVKTVEQRVFKARKRLKRARSVVRLLKVPLGSKTQTRLADTLRGVGKALSPARDADVLVASARTLATTAKPEHADIFGGLVTNLEARADIVRSRLHTDMDQGRSAMRAAEADAQRLPLKFAAETVLDTAFERVYGRGRAYRQIAIQTGRAEAFHDWRKFAKQRWHLSLLVRNLRHPDFAEVIAQLSQLGKLLGTDHDYAVLEEVCQRRPALAGPIKVRRLIRTQIREQQNLCREQALELANGLYDASVEDALTAFHTAYASPLPIAPISLESSALDTPSGAAPFVRQNVPEASEAE